MGYYERLYFIDKCKCFQPLFNDEIKYPPNKGSNPFHNLP
jgi:hypothetical protein